MIHGEVAMAEMGLVRQIPGELHPHINLIPSHHDLHFLFSILIRTCFIVGARAMLSGSSLSPLLCDPRSNSCTVAGARYAFLLEELR